MQKQKVSLRPYRHGDRQEFVALFTDSEVMRYVGDGRALDVAAAEVLFAKIFEKYEHDRSFLVWAVEEDGRYAAHAELKRRSGRDEYEIVYILQRARWGRALGGEIADLLVSQARERGLAFIIATVDPENAASVAILRKRGFSHDARLSGSLGCCAYRLDLGSER